VGKIERGEEGGDRGGRLLEVRVHDDEACAVQDGGTEPALAGARAEQGCVKARLRDDVLVHERRITVPGIRV
jgi:hypothetical protein